MLYDLIFCGYLIFLDFFLCTYFELVPHAQRRQPSHANKETFLDHAFADAM